MTDVNIFESQIKRLFFFYSRPQTTEIYNLGTIQTHEQES